MPRTRRQCRSSGAELGRRRGDQRHGPNVTAARGRQALPSRGNRRGVASPRATSPGQPTNEERHHAAARSTPPTTAPAESRADPRRHRRRPRLRPEPGRARPPPRPALLAGFDGLRRAVGQRQLDPVSARSPGSRSAWPSTTATASPSTRRCSAVSGSTRPTSTAMRAGGPGRPDAGRGLRARPGDRPRPRQGRRRRRSTRARHAGLDDRRRSSRSSPSASSPALVGTIDNLAGRVELDGFLGPAAWS